MNQPSDTQVVLIQMGFISAAVSDTGSDAD